MKKTLKQRSSDHHRGIYFIGTTPPKIDTPFAQMSAIADKLLARLDEISFDGLIVYDIQDETSRNDSPRPFPFKATHDSGTYSQLINQKSAKPVITYKSVAGCSADSFQEWLSRAWHQNNIRDLVLVGSPSADAARSLSLAEAYQGINQHPQDFYLGGVAIAERHLSKGNEHLRLLSKKQQGCEYYITQAVYNPQATIDMLTSYAAECRAQGLNPNRIILTFSPCGSAKTLDFINWLGVSVPAATSERILNSDDPLHESIKINHANLKQILDAVLPLNIPLGLNIESLTNRKAEIDASIYMYKLLKGTMDQELALNQIMQVYNQ
ncbi:methylenetetrahydrofolate reductase [Paraferrimonas sp. SM1919]|uniref:methylenetetrahydrofolate reductase n=1 Tax=Paraferrimonas sp. SM1919 TaxID=2662263 RepID=UPI0013D8D05F|nr:hypothetical protein [Paraferrimonas sp. SM1919]